MFVGLVPRRDLCQERHSWRCKFSGMGFWAREVGCSLLSALFQWPEYRSEHPLEPRAAASSSFCRLGVTSVLLISPPAEELPQLGEP